jgi:hypothetical protein
MAARGPNAEATDLNPCFLRASNQRLTAMPTSVPQVDPDRQGRSKVA